MITTFGGYNVLTMKPVGQLSLSPSSEFKILGDPHQRQTKITNKQPQFGIRFQVMLRDTTDRAALRSFYDGQLGPLTPFWVRTWGFDATLAQAAASTDDFVVVHLGGEDAALSGMNRWLYSPDLDDAFHVEDVTASTNTVRLDLDKALGGALAVGSHLEMFLFVRFDGLLQIKTSGGIATSSTMSLVELQANTPTP